MSDGTPRQTQLFAHDRRRRHRWTGTLAIERRQPGCPECGGPLVSVTAHQPALFRHGGYGATRRTTWTACPHCRWSLEAAVDEVRP